MTCCADPCTSPWPQVSLEPGVKVWSVNSRGIGDAPAELVASLDGREGCFHPLDGSVLLVAGSQYAIWADDTLRLWDVSSLHLAASIKKERHIDAVTSLAFSMDDKRLASGSMDRSIRVWHTPAGSSLVDAPCAGMYRYTAPRIYTLHLAHLFIFLHSTPLALAPSFDRCCRHSQRASRTVVENILG